MRDVVAADAPSEAVTRRRRGKLRAAAVEMRPAEWVKNVFVAAPLVFSGHLGEADRVWRAVAETAAFCLMASAGYLVNDIRDVELDRQHPTKRRRPIAAGELPVPVAITLAVVLAAAALGLSSSIGWRAAAYVAGYAVLTFSYSLVLKRLVIIDVLAIAAGFLIRVLAGVAATRVLHSDWLIVCTGSLAMFLGFTKRRQEAASELHLGLDSRPVLEHYSLPFLDQMVSMVSTATVLSYVLYTVNSPLIGSRMLPTAGPVVYGVLRYLYLVYHCKDQRSTATIIRKDPGIVAAGATWVAIAVLLLYTR
jgi:4-hydroxybenzoate polyprenyltransferase